jgi:hypothetical protein
VVLIICSFTGSDSDRSAPAKNGQLNAKTEVDLMGSAHHVSLSFLATTCTCVTSSMLYIGGSIPYIGGSGRQILILEADGW